VHNDARELSNLPILGTRSFFISLTEDLSLLREEVEKKKRLSLKVVEVRYSVGQG
jgi:hypothetical protein